MVVQYLLVLMTALLWTISCNGISVAYELPNMEVRQGNMFNCGKKISSDRNTTPTHSLSLF